MSEHRGLNPAGAFRPARGFTLVELMITIFVAFILMGLALPSFRDLIMSNHVTETTNALLTDLNLARSEAVNRGAQVRLLNNNGASSSDWSGSWKVAADTAFDGSFATVLRENPGVDVASNYSVKSKVTVLASASGATPTDGAVVFTGQGTMLPKASSYDFNICRPDSQPAKSKRITIALSGMMSSMTGTSGSPAPGC